MKYVTVYFICLIIYIFLLVISGSVRPMCSCLLLDLRIILLQAHMEKNKNRCQKMIVLPDLFDG